MGKAVGQEGRAIPHPCRGTAVMGREDWGGATLKSPVAPSMWKTAQPPHSLPSTFCSLLVINGGLRLFPCTKVHHGKAQGTGKLGSAKKAEGTS